VAISERACVAVEAMKGTDAMLRRAASLANGRPLRQVKASWKHLLLLAVGARRRRGNLRNRLGGVEHFSNTVPWLASQ